MVADAPERSRFEINVDGRARRVRRVPAAPRAGSRSCTPRSTTPTRGQGLGGQLVRAALDDVRGRGLAVRPDCPFIKGWIAKHPDYADLVPADQRADYDLG